MGPGPPDPDYFALSRHKMIATFVTGEWMQLLERTLIRGLHAAAKLRGEATRGSMAAVTTSRGGECISGQPC